MSTFGSGVPALDDWLKRRALANEESGASRTYVVCVQGKRVVGYYALANGGVAVQAATGRTRRNMPDPIPVMVLGHLAVDKAHQGHGRGRGLFQDAILRTIQAAEIGGIRAILVHAISEDAKRFYERCGFRVSPLDPMTLKITVAEAEKSISDEGTGERGVKDGARRVTGDVLTEGRWRRSRLAHICGESLIACQ